MKLGLKAAPATCAGVVIAGVSKLCGISSISFHWRKAADFIHDRDAELCPQLGRQRLNDPVQRSPPLCLKTFSNPAPSLPCAGWVKISFPPGSGNRARHTALDNWPGARAWQGTSPSQAPPQTAKGGRRKAEGEWQQHMAWE